MENKFADDLRIRTKKFAIDIVYFCRTLEKAEEAFILKKQLIRSATSVAANYRAACRARSKQEWYAKICIVVEESDESNFWLDLINDLELKCDEKKLHHLMKESNEILKIMAVSRKTAAMKK